MRGSNGKIARAELVVKRSRNGFFTVLTEMERFAASFEWESPCERSVKIGPKVPGVFPRIVYSRSKVA
jgi:hypothetical protein